jgi:hypothetical protein
MRHKIIMVALAVFSLTACTDAPAAQASADEAVAIGTVCEASISIGEGYVTDIESVEARIAVLEVLRGEKAWETVKAADASNRPPDPGMEYVAVRVRFEYAAQDGRDQSYGIRDEQFASVSGAGKPYERPSVVPPAPALNGRLYPGDSLEGWIVLSVSVDDPRPLMTFGNNYNRIWFRLY